jgi:hypothetical protein
VEDSIDVNLKGVSEWRINEIYAIEYAKGNA